MRINKITLLIIFMLGSLYSCSSQKELQQERCNVLNDVMPTRYKTRIMNWILTNKDIENRELKFSPERYFSLDTLDYAYRTTPMYELQVSMRGSPKELYSLLTKEDLENMKTQYNESGKYKHIVSKDCFESSDVFLKRAKREEGEVVSLPLFSTDKQKCIFFYFSNISRQWHPNICICKKENGKWKLVAQIDGSLYDESLYYD